MKAICVSTIASKQGVDILSKTKGSNGEVGTYLHVMFRSSAELIQRRFI